MFCHIFPIVLVLFVAQIGGYTTWDGKVVPQLPEPVNAVVCSTTAQFYMAVRTQQPGKTIVLKPGTYAVGPFEPIRIDSAGVTIRGMSDDPSQTVLVGLGFENCDSPEEEMIRLYTQNTTIANLTISEVRCNALKFQWDVNDRTLLHNVRFLNVGERMIKGPGTTSAVQCTIRYCHFENTKIPSNPRCGSDNMDRDGNYIGGMDIMNADAWAIHDCYFKSIRGSGGGGRAAIFIWGGSQGYTNTDMVVERNTFISCDRAIAYGNPSGNNNVNGGDIRNNFIVRGANLGIEMEKCSNVRIYNNTLYSTDPTYSRAVFFENNTTGNEFRNNIVFGNVSGSVTTMSDNLIRNGLSDANTNWFVNRTTADLHLTSSATPAINSGAAGLVTGDWDAHGRIDGQCDIGADEYNSVVVEAPGTLLSGDNGFDIAVQPNPFNATVVISGVADMQVAIYDIRGNLVRRLAHNDHGTAVWWNASAMPSGIYVVHAQVNGLLRTKMISLQK